jgi:hypothetical protein
VALREAVIRFNEQLGQRKEQFGYLNAYKELHDMLHNLQQIILPQIPVTGHRVPPQASVLLKAAVQTVEKQLPNTEFENEHRDWAERFQTAARELGDKTTFDLAREVLANLPAEQQKILNEELVRCARRLRVTELKSLLEDIVLKLGTDAEALGNGVISFHNLCGQLTDAADNHDLCQDIEGWLLQTGDRRCGSPDELKKWVSIRNGVTKIAANRPADTAATEMVQLAEAFERHAALGEREDAEVHFEMLLAQFRHLFFMLDKEMREVTRDLLSEVKSLDARIKGFLK